MTAKTEMRWTTVCQRDHEGAGETIEEFSAWCKRHRRCHIREVQVREA